MSKYDEINKQLKKRSTAFIGSSTGDRCLFIHSPFDEGVVETVEDEVLNTDLVPYKHR